MFVNLCVLRNIKEFSKSWIITLIFTHQIRQNTIARCAICKPKAILLFLLLLEGELHEIYWKLIVIFKSIIDDELHQFYIILLENGNWEPYHQSVHVLLYASVSCRASFIAATDAAGVVLGVLALKSYVVGGIYTVDIIWFIQIVDGIQST